MKLIPNWDFVKLSLMYQLLRKRFQRPDLKRLLAATKNYSIVEGNYWHGLYWGKCTCKTHKWTGNNMLGNISKYCFYITKFELNNWRHCDKKFHQNSSIQSKATPKTANAEFTSICFL